MKICRKCNIEQQLFCFHKDKGKKDGLSYWCKLCEKTYKDSQLYKKSKVKSDKKYYNSNKENILSKNRRWKKEHQELLKIKNKEYARYKLNVDIVFKLKKRLRCRLYLALKGNFKSGSAVRDLGCSVEFLRQYLESKFTEGMSWDNYGFYGWHIDHLIPLASFDLTNREQFLKACHYSNLQPLWMKENLAKSDHLPEDK